MLSCEFQPGRAAATESDAVVMPTIGGGRADLLSVRGGTLREMNLLNARGCLAAGEPERAAEWLANLPERERPGGLVAAIEDSRTRAAARDGDWQGAIRTARAAVAAESTPRRQARLARLRARHDLLSAHELEVIAAATPPPARAPRELLPEVEGVVAAGAYYSRGRGSAAPWSRYLRLSKEPSGDACDRAAIFRLAAGYIAACEQRDGRALLDADVVVPVPANPARYARRGASLPDALAEGLSTSLALDCALFALAWSEAAQDVEMKRLSHRDRREVSGRLFDVGPEIDAINEAGVLLVDDLMTSGATLRAAARVLKQHGARVVHAAVLAHTEG